MRSFAVENAPAVPRHPVGPRPPRFAASSAAAQPAADYCTLLTKADVEAVLKTRTTKVEPAPLKEIPSTTMHDQTCLYAAGSRVLRMTVTETLSPAQAQGMFNIDLMGYATVNGGKPTALPGIDDQAVMASPRVVVLRKGKLVIDISVADFADSDAERAALAAALVAKAADKIK